MSTHRQRLVYSFHGPLPSKLVTILDSHLCRVVDSDVHAPTRWFTDAGLDEFARIWPNIFLVDTDGDIWVTQHNSFGAR
jgi:hypothetical protein